MPGAKSSHTNLSWFNELCCHDQIVLLLDPWRPLEREAAHRILATLRRVPGGAPRILAREDGGLRRWYLTGIAVSELLDTRNMLDSWWSSEAMSDAERGYLIDHRADPDLPPRAVLLAPTVVRAYLELMAQQRDEVNS